MKNSKEIILIYVSVFFLEISNPKPWNTGGGRGGFNNRGGRGGPPSRGGGVINRLQNMAGTPKQQDTFDVIPNSLYQSPGGDASYKHFF